MPVEIERRYLVRANKLSELPDGELLVQGYLAFSPAVRVRTSPSSGWITVKGPGKVERAEYEYEIPRADARRMLKLCSASLKKVRRKIKVGAHTWDLDEFRGPHKGLWLAEVELSSRTEEFVKPAWAGKEVTGDSRYSNASLARAGRRP